MLVSDKITPLEWEGYQHFCWRYLNQPSFAGIPKEQTLAEYNKSKKFLYRLLGKNLRVYIPVDLSKIGNKEICRELTELTNIEHFYLPSTPYWVDTSSSYKFNLAEERAAYWKDCNRSNHKPYDDFIISVFSHLYSYVFPDLYSVEGDFAEENLDNIKYFLNLFKGKYLVSKATNLDIIFRIEGKKPIKVARGTKTVKAIRKVLIQTDYPHMEQFEEWRNAISNITTKNTKSTLVLSIHPVDYITMSDNNSSWTSCMSWSGGGCHNSGVIEMMNSNVVGVAYLQSSTKYEINEYVYPNKSWRVLFYANKDIITVGTAYPYENEILEKLIVQELEKLAKKNLNLTYKFHQEYSDMLRFYGSCSNYYLKNNYKLRNNSNKLILFTTRGMYNDPLEQGLHPYCARNPVKKTKRINLSGKMTCPVCGKVIEDEEYVQDLQDGRCGQYSGRVEDIYCIKKHKEKEG